MTESLSFLSWLSGLQVQLFTWQRGTLVGTDKFGNRYFRDRKRRPGQRERRWVIYAGEPEATKVPPEWFGWLHHTQDQPLPEKSVFHKPWQKEHRPNPSGTAEAYLPPGHALQGGHRAAATGDYEPWIPS